MISAVRFSPAKRLEAIGLNPQPLPPRYGHRLPTPGPLTPRMWSHVETKVLNPEVISPRDNSRYQKVALNPQPLPPKVFAEVALNPQPLPPSLLHARTLGFLR